MVRFCSEFHETISSGFILWGHIFWVVHMAEVVSRGATWADLVCRDICGTAEVFCGYTGIRDKRIRDKSPRMGEDFSLD